MSNTEQCMEPPAIRTPRSRERVKTFLLVWLRPCSAPLLLPVFVNGFYIFVQFFD